MIKLHTRDEFNGNSYDTGFRVEIKSMLAECRYAANKVRKAEQAIAYATNAVEEAKAVSELHVLIHSEHMLREQFERTSQVYADIHALFTQALADLRK